MFRAAPAALVVLLTIPTIWSFRKWAKGTVEAASSHGQRPAQLRHHPFNEHRFFVTAQEKRSRPAPMSHITIHPRGSTPTILVVVGLETDSWTPAILCSFNSCISLHITFHTSVSQVNPTSYKTSGQQHAAHGKESRSPGKANPTPGTPTMWANPWRPPSFDSQCHHRQFGD